MSLFPLKLQRLAGYIDICPGFHGQQDGFLGQSLAVLQESIKSSVAAQDSMGFQLPEAEGLRDVPVENVLGKTDLI